MELRYGRDLYSRDNVMVIAGTEVQIPGIVISLLSSGVRNFFLGNAGSVFYSDIILNSGGSEALGKYEFMFRRNDSFFLVDFAAEM